MLNEISKIPTLSGKSRYPGKLILVYCFWFMAGSLLFAQSREEKVQQLLRREDVKVTELEKDLLKIEYPNGKVLYKNIADYQNPVSSIQHPVTYSPNYDSTIIDLTTIDTMLYYHKYSFWQEVL